SPMPHARVRGIDAREALSMPGVLGMLTAEDVPTPDAPGEACLTMSLSTRASLFLRSPRSMKRQRPRPSNGCG
ncbi:MAG: hypothetical protein OEZ54_06390, partial [Gemmatimonadota bacterium]|nr:hypothetical protein [Gemmatimonadota bacterium]